MFNSPLLVTYHHDAPNAEKSRDGSFGHRDITLDEQKAKSVLCPNGRRAQARAGDHRRDSGGAASQDS
jgi:hypothetical protein